jgi:hypothetical protein
VLQLLLAVVLGYLLMVAFLWCGYYSKEHGISNNWPLNNTVASVLFAPGYPWLAIVYAAAIFGVLTWLFPRRASG